MTSRRRWRSVPLAIALVAGTVLAGYLVTCAIFPAPILPKQVTVPQLRGLAADSATRRLAMLRLRARIADSNYDPLTSAGTVSWQSPVEGTMLPEGAVVQFSVSNGPPPVTVPDVSLLDIALAREVIAAAGLRAGGVDTAQRDADPGTVLSTMPQGGTTARAGELVRIVVSGGPAAVRVPALAGLTVVSAGERLADAGLRIGRVDQRFEGKAGTVLAQRPSPGELVRPGSAVDLTVSGAIP